MIWFKRFVLDIAFFIFRYWFNESFYWVLCRLLYWWLHEDDRQMLDGVDERDYNDVIAMYHHNFGRWLRNELHLWERTAIVRYFDKEYGISHADDISSLIILGIIFRNDQEIRRNVTETEVEKFKKHWKEWTLTD